MQGGGPIAGGAQTLTAGNGRAAGRRLPATATSSRTAHLACCRSANNSSLKHSISTARHNACWVEAVCPGPSSGARCLKHLLPCPPRRPSCSGAQTPGGPADSVKAAAFGEGCGTSGRSGCSKLGSWEGRCPEVAQRSQPCQLFARPVWSSGACVHRAILYPSTSFPLQTSWAARPSGTTVLSSSCAARGLSCR